MITGDHVVTAGAVAGELGIPGEAVTGADLDLLADDDLADRLEHVGVVARVTPAHKIRMVRALQARGDVVAMTGDGVNDAPALRRADIGVAMGITGTEVSKEAATMVLTDDNFSSIVSAVREGRGIYDNIVKFTRFQVSTALGFVLTFLVASVIGIADGAPFTALQILFVNLVMDGPPAMSLGVDPVAHDAMSRPPRPAGERILTRTRLIRILLSSTVMAVGTLAVLIWAPGPEPRAGEASVAGTMAFVTFVFFQAFNLLNVRHDTRSTFSRETLENASAFVATAVVIVLLILVVELDALSAFFSTTDLTSRQWLACAAVGSGILWTGELVKAVLRHRARRHIAPPGDREQCARPTHCRSVPVVSARGPVCKTARSNVPASRTSQAGANLGVQVTKGSSEDEYGPGGCALASVLGRRAVWGVAGHEQHVEAGLVRARPLRCCAIPRTMEIPSHEAQCAMSQRRRVDHSRRNHGHRTSR